MGCGEVCLNYHSYVVETMWVAGGCLLLALRAVLDALTRVTTWLPVKYEGPTLERRALVSFLNSTT